LAYRGDIILGPTVKTHSQIDLFYYHDYRLANLLKPYIKQVIAIVD
jgi:hypothetical protein